MLLVAIIGPFRANTAWEIEQNCRQAELVALEVWRAGAVALCPHLNTRHFHGMLPDQVWLDGYVSVLRRCDAAVLVPGWEHSAGSLVEKAEAERLGMPVFRDVPDLREWIEWMEDHSHGGKVDASHQ